MSSISENLFMLFQRLLPKYLLTTLVYHLARVRAYAIKNFLIRRFVSFYGVNVEEAALPIPDGFESFNAFFTRELAPGARTVDSGAATIVSPVDGTVSAVGKIDDDQIFQAKGLRYSLSDLLSADLQEGDNYVGGHFATIYLAPYNYHRVHAPLAGQLRVAHYVPGDLYSVNATTARRLPGLFARNERLVCHFSSDHGPWVLIFVGAMNVGSISTPWTGEIRPRKNGIVMVQPLDNTESSRDVNKGDLLGWFNMGSTVIMLLPATTYEWSDKLIPGSTVDMGRSIGHRLSSAS